MLIDDLKKLQEDTVKNSEGIVNKYKVEMIYYLVIESVIKKYGTSSTNSMSKIHHDALGCARDQIAMRLSDNGTVNYSKDGEVKRLTKDNLQKIVHEAFLNSEALRKTISANLASNEYRKLDSSKDDLDNVLYDLTDERLKQEADVNRLGSLANQVWQMAEHFDDSMETSDHSKYAMYMGNVEYDVDQNIKTIPDSKNKHVMLKISPLLPELRNLRRIGVPVLGLDSNKDNKYANAILQYDAQKGALSAALSYEDYINVENRQNGFGNQSSEYDDTLVIKPTEYGKIETTLKSYTFSESTGNDLEDMSNAVVKETKVQLLDDYKITRDINTVMKWRMLEVLDKYSSQNLTDNDIEGVNAIFNNSFYNNGILFGNISESGIDTIEENANAYFEYLDHVCSVAKDKMQSHEFEAHLKRATYNEHNSNDMVYMLYFTGEQTDDFNTAKKNGSRFLNTFIYTNYTPKNMTVSPIIGDMGSASFNSYLITNKELRGETSVNSNMLDAFRNKYFHANRITKDMVKNMSKTFDEYTLKDNRALDPNIVIRKITKNVGETEIDDLSSFITVVGGKGIVNTAEIFKKLSEERDIAKQEQREQFLNNNNSTSFSNVLNEYMSKNGHKDDMPSALYHMVLKNQNIRTLADLRREFTGKLTNNLAHELRNQYGIAQNSFVISNHIFTKYVHNYVNDCMTDLCEHLKNNGVILNSDIELTNINDCKPFIPTLNLDNAYNKTVTAMSDDKSKILSDSLDELFGTDKVIKANTCKYASRKFPADVYEDLLKLLSYDDKVVYETNKVKSINELNETAQRDNKSCIIQLYSNKLLEMSDVDALNEIADVQENIEDEDSAGEDVSFESESWYISTFASVDNDDDISYRDIESRNQDMAVFRATHPLQTAAMQNVAKHMKSFAGVYDLNNLKITKQGVIYYQDVDASNNKNTLFKIGPVIDECAYIHPIVEEDENGTLINRPVLDYNNNIKYDANGKVITESVRVNVIPEIRVDGAGNLINKVSFGALDTPSFIGKEDSVPNRFYGISSKIYNYDGYDHTGKDFIDRLQFSTYQSNVLNAIDDNMALYKIVSFGMNDNVNAKIGLSVLYTNTGANSLLKCYRTNTYILEDKEKSAMAHHYMSNLLNSDDEKFAILTDEDKNNELARETLKKVANMTMMQSKMYHNRVVMPKIKIDQNIGLYNMVLNMSQCAYSEIKGSIDRKNMRLTDSKSARAAVFDPNPMFDNTLTGTAKQLGAVAFFTDAVKFDPITCEHRVLNKDDHARCTIISTGILDVENGGIDCRMNNYPGGQAVDRQQLSNNAAEKSLNYATNMKFAMISLGHNMEDGYCVASRAAGKIGHFGKDGKFHVDNNWDKIGDTESGNKGVTAKVIDTSIAEDIMDDDLADIEFRTVFTQKYLSNYLFNYSKNSDAILNNDMSKLLDEIAEKYPTAILGNTFAEKMSTLINKHVEDVKDTYSNSSQKEIDKALKEAYEKRDDEIKDFYSFIGEHLEQSKKEPFYGAFKLEQAQWRLFRDNPDLDLAVTNVCVLTRSNPSLLMYITDELHKDQENNTQNSVLITRDENNNKIKNMGACGKYNIYVDSHTAEDKNRDYTESFARSGRKYGSQELYALTAKFCNDDFIKLVTANDPTFSERILTKLNHRLMMNGYVFDPNDDLKAKTIPDYLTNKDNENGNVIVKPKSEDDPVNMISDDIACTSFVDMDYFAKMFVSKMINNEVTENDFKVAVADLAENKYGRLFSIIDKNLSESRVDEKNTMAEDRLHYFFTTQFGQFGGNFAILPESLSNVALNVYHESQDKYAKDNNMADASIINDDYDFGYSMQDDAFVPDGRPLSVIGRVNIENDDKLIEKKVVPLFLSSREFAVNDGEMQGAVVDDKLQFDMYKTILTGAILDNARDYIGEEMYSDISKTINTRLKRDYQKVTSTKSLDISDMNKWLKKNVYNIVFPKSLTAVWSGDPTLEIDEVGLSFEKVKNLGLLRLKDESAPDDYEHMLDRYEALGDDDLVLINRSPGQTTGCIRALRVRITGPDGDGIRVHPAIATVFDGDFDGDTIGVINYKAVNCQGVTKEMVDAATEELKHTMTMQANLVQTAAYTKIEAKNADALSNAEPVLQDNGSIKYINPLFIAGNSDIAIAKHNMKAANYISSMGKNIDDTLDTINISANIVEQLKQINKDLDNVSKGYITKEDFANSSGDDLLSRRIEQIEALKSYFAVGDKDGIYISGQINDIHDAIEVKQKLVLADIPHDDVYNTNLKKATESIQNLISNAEKHNKEQLASVYRDMTPYITEKPLYTHGKSDFEILENIINDANISKKGKIPQLNALLMFSGVHARCNEIHDGVKNTGLIVVQDEATKKYEIRMQQPDTPQGVKIEQGSALREQVIKNTKLDYKRAVSDVPKNEYKTQIESNIVAQSDKSDGTGFGGSTAQKMQKIFGSMGYAELGLRISGPITQMFLDAKQNVVVCEKNLMVGKFLLEKICRFEYVHELTNTEYNKSRPEQVRNGQFTFNDPNPKHKGKRYLTIQEGIEQLDNFMDMMGLDRFSPIDKQIMKTCLSKFADSKGYLKNVIEKCDKENDRTYTAMYSTHKFADYLDYSAKNNLSLYSGSVAYQGKINTEAMITNVKAKNDNRNITNKMTLTETETEITNKESKSTRIHADLSAVQNTKESIGRSTRSLTSRDTRSLTSRGTKNLLSGRSKNKDTTEVINELQDTMSTMREQIEQTAKSKKSIDTMNEMIKESDSDTKDETVTNIEIPGE